MGKKKISKILNTTSLSHTRTHIHDYQSFNAIPYLYGIVILKWSKSRNGNPQPQAIHSSDAAANNQLLLCMQMKRPSMYHLRAGIDGLLRGLEVALFTSDAASIIAPIHMHTVAIDDVLDYGRQLSSAAGANAGNVVTALEHSAHGPSVGCQIIFIIAGIEFGQTVMIMIEGWSWKINQQIRTGKQRRKLRSFYGESNSTRVSSFKKDDLT
uniref:Uncharacterized protein n=1 Tax=Glossina pallidipes TaxID=7398 RepID=A0A1B0AG26_GLOPL